MSEPEQPTLTDGVVTLRPWHDEDVERAIAGHDEQIAHWLGFPSGVIQPSAEQMREAVEGSRRGWSEGRRVASFVIEHDADLAGTCELRREPDATTASLYWTLFSGFRGRGLASRAVRVLSDWAMTEPGQGGLGLSRVEAHVEPGNDASLRVATRAGLRREGLRRVAPGTGDRPETTEYVVLARLASDPPLTDPQSFRALLNSFLPRKRAIGQLLVTDAADRVLLCQLTYKRDWDLPGGVVEVGESPRLAVGREVSEELGLQLSAGDLLLTDWLPPWGGWDDALCLVFDGGVHDESLLSGVVRQVREIRTAEFCTLDQVEERAADFTVRRVRAALANRASAHGSGDGSGGTGGPAYTESGR